MNAQTQKKGFTIIEVVLVLAIAALIFLMIFVALPALQRGQRDTARKNEAGSIASAVTSFRSNTRGNLPSDAGDLSSYLTNLNQITSYDVQARTAYADPAPDAAVVVPASKCGTDNKPVSGSPKQAAVIVGIENGGIYCQEA